MRNSWLVQRLALVVVCVLAFSNCEQRPRNNQFSISESAERMTCGTHVASVNVKIHGDENGTNLFAIMLAGSPVTRYFSQESSQAHDLLRTLLDHGFRVAEIKYDQKDGFYGACRAQGISSVVAHSAQLYDVAMQKLGADPHNSKHTIVGVGFSIGAAQLQAMTFMEGRRVDKVALVGVLVGDVEQGCKSFLDNKDDGYTWRVFHGLARALTKNQTGCYPPSEYTASLNFENQAFADKGDVALFEGELFGRAVGAAGNIDQAKYIEAKRREIGAPVKLYSYSSCGHEVLACSNGKAGTDILNFLIGPWQRIKRTVLGLFGL